MRLLNIDSNAKTVKGQTRGYMTAVLYLAPGNASGFQVCPMATQGCLAACLNTAGRGGMAKAKATFDANGTQLPDNTIQRARIARTRFYFEHRAAFMAQLHDEIKRFVRKAERKGLTPCVRLNGTSDIPWERVPVTVGNVTYGNMFDAFPHVQFYDYTKRANRSAVVAGVRVGLPRNYRLTFSLAENNEHYAKEAFLAGMNIAAVFRTKSFPPAYAIDGVSIPTHNGDESDLRFLDPQGVIVALYAKGKAKRDQSGFVRD